MPIKQLEYPKFRADDANGNPLSGGKVYTYVAGTVSTDLTTWTDEAKTSENTNPIILDANGEANIWFDSPVKIKLDDKDDVQQWTVDDIPPNATPTASGVYNLVQNGSFEESATEATNWTLSPSANATIAVDAADSVHGVRSLKFTSTDSGGAGTAVSAKFAVEIGKGVLVGFSYKTTEATSLNTVGIKWYNLAGTALSTDSLYSDGTAEPSTYTTFTRLAYAPANAVQAEIILTGVSSGGTTKTGVTNFDNVVVTEQCSVHQVGVTAPKNYLEVTNSTTSGDVIVTVNGIDTNADVDIQGKGSGVGRLDGLSASQFLRSDADDTTTGNLTISNITPLYKFYETDAGLDQKYWRNFASTEALNFDILDDAQANTKTWGNVSRSGTGAGITVDNITWTATEINLVGNTNLDVVKVSGDIINEVTSNYTGISGSTASNTGANLLLYGSTFAPWANDFALRDATTRIIDYDSSASKITLASTDIDIIGATAVDDLEATGDVTIPTAGKGVAFTGNTAASGMTSEVLDWYEEGTWTPSLQDPSFSSGEGQTYTKQTGLYTRIGRLVTVEFYIEMSALGTLSGPCYINGLPFPALGWTAITVGRGDGLAIAAGNSVGGSTQAGQTYMNLVLWDVASGISAMTAAEISSNGLLMGTCSYTI